MKRAAVFTLGCKVNQYESESISAQLQDAGYEVVDWREIADLYVVHTCAVTSQAAAKSRQQIHQAHRKNPEAQIVVMGCYAQLDAEVISEMPGVRFVIGTTERQRFLGNLAQRILDKRDDRVENLVREFQTDETFEEMKGINQADYSRPMIKIQEGCNNFCSYCIIPYLRGPERSREAEHILEEVRGLVAQGYQEIVLTGIHLSAWGKDLVPQQHITDLLRAITRVEGLHRVRISSVEPTDVDESWLDFMVEEPKFCRHLHIPLQSGCDTVLSRMNRRYHTAYYRELVSKLRTRLPNIAISTDLIVGFPGETEEEARQTYEFCQEMKFSRMHVFRFSARKGTVAATLPHPVLKEVAERRSQEIRELAGQMMADYAHAFIGKELEVLLEEGRNGADIAEGYSDEYIRIRVPYKGKIPKGGQLVRVHITGWSSEGLIAEIR